MTLLCFAFPNTNAWALLGGIQVPLLVRIVGWYRSVDLWLPAGDRGVGDAEIAWWDIRLQCRRVIGASSLEQPLRRLSVRHGD